MRYYEFNAVFQFYLFSHKVSSGHDWSCLLCVSDMTLTWLVQIQPQVFTAKRSERQVVVSNGKDGGSYVTRLTSLRTETWSRLNEMDKPAALISIFKRKLAFPSLDILEHSERKELLDQSSLGSEAC